MLASFSLNSCVVDFLFKKAATILALRRVANKKLDCSLSAIFGVATKAHCFASAAEVKLSTAKPCGPKFLSIRRAQASLTGIARIGSPSSSVKISSIIISKGGPLYDFSQ